MPVLRINGKQVEVDVESELRQYSWDRERWSSDKLIACSPFRDDNAPSFFVNLDGEFAGTFGDSGAYDSEYERGSFVKLLGYLRGTSEYEAVEYLIEEYGVLYEINEDADSPIRIIAPKLKETRKDIALISTVTTAVSPYLITRGIDGETQERFGIGYNPANKGYTAIPWHYVDTGEIANVKYRSTRGKRFFYEPDAKPISEIVYGLWHAKGEEYIIICEGEIDALSWETAGYASIAVGSAHISDKQAEMIIREGFGRIYLAGDNDEQGRKLNRMAADKLRGYAELFTVEYAKEKDANDVLLRSGVRELGEMLVAARPVKAINLRLG